MAIKLDREPRTGVGAGMHRFARLITALALSAGLIACGGKDKKAPAAPGQPGQPGEQAMNDGDPTGDPGAPGQPGEQPGQQPGQGRQGQPGERTGEPREGRPNGEPGNDLERLLDRVALDRFVRLLAVPRTAARGTQAMHDANQLLERFADRHGGRIAQR